MLLEKFQLKIKDYQASRVGLLVAVSGGIDSVVLCDLLHHSGIKFSIAHCNFQLRGEESERDENFVKGLAAKYEAEFFLEKFDTEEYADANKVSIQVAAREMRYDWFRMLIDQSSGGLKFIVTAHHADDNIETVLMNFFRGTGLRGLIGMDEVFENIYRPLLPFRKEEISRYAKDNNLQYVEDSSNASSNYTRNFFRNDLIPAISKVFPQVEENILANAGRLKDVEEIYNQAIRKHKEKLVEQQGIEEHIPILKLQKTSSFRTILWEIIREKNFTAGQLDEVIKLMDAANGSFIQSPTHRIIKNRKWLIVTSLQTGEVKHYVIDQADTEIIFADQRLKIETTTNTKLPTSNMVACLDAGKISFPLLLRKWKQGDYFYPLGMSKKKKLSKFFIDQKLSRTEKENVWVLESDKRIIWIVNHRIDDRFKIQPSTKNILMLTSTDALQ